MLIMGLALSLSKYLALSALRFSEKLIIIGLPVGISNLLISISDILKRYLHKALKELP